MNDIRRLHPPVGMNFHFSNNWWMVFTVFLNNLLLCSVHKIQTQRSHMSCIKDLLVVGPPIKWENWRKWSGPSNKSALETPIQWRTNCHNSLKIWQEKKMISCFHITAPRHTHMRLQREDPMSHKIRFGWQPDAEKSPSKNRHLNWDMSMPYRIWYRVHNLTVICCEHMAGKRYAQSIHHYPQASTSTDQRVEPAK